MAASVNIHEAKTNFSKLVRRAEAGEEIVVRRGREPVARIAPLEKKECTAIIKRATELLRRRYA